MPRSAREDRCDQWQPPPVQRPAVVRCFVIVHPLFVLLGMVGLARAMTGQHYRYPLFGVARDEVKR